jgi:hypothetical protein
MAFATFAAPAAAQLDEQGGGGAVTVESATVLGESVKSKAALANATAASAAPVRPDDRGDRFAHSDAVGSGTQLESGREWNVGLGVGLGIFALALGLGMALGYVGRPRIAGTH